MEKKKLCLIIPTLQAGGMERTMSELAVFFCSKPDLDVHLILYGSYPEIFYSVPVNLKIHKPATDMKYKSSVFYFFNRLFYLRKRVRQINPDSLLSFGEVWNNFVLIALLFTPYPVYISDRCSPERKFKLYNRILRRILYPKVDGIIVQTEKAREIYQTQFPGSNIIAIGNPIRVIKTEDNTPRENIVLMVGRLIRTKHQDKLIELFLKISKPGWSLIIVGYDHLKQNNSERLKRIIADNKAENLVILAGKQENVDSYYLKSKIFAFTSSSEGFPNVVGEAMSAGLPVIAFDCVAGPSEMIIDERNGFLIPLHNYKMFRERLEMLMDHEEIRKSFGDRALEDIKAFTIEKIGKKYLELILNNY